MGGSAANILGSDGTFPDGAGLFTGSVDAAVDASFSWDGEANATINEATEMGWHVQLQHAVSVVMGEQYTVCFSAKAEATRTIVVNIDQGGSPGYDSVMAEGAYEPLLSTSYQDYSYSFTSSVDDTTSRLTLNLGLEDVDVQLDNIGVYVGSECGDPSNIPEGPVGSGSDNITGTPPITTEGNQVLFGGEQGSVAGVSLFWSQWDVGSVYYTPEVVAKLKNEWNAKLIRAAIAVDAEGGYLLDPASNRNRATTIVDAAIENDMYVIIDWHTHNAEDYQAEAIAFFVDMAETYGEYNNVIYEIYNEPDCPKTVAPVDCSWDTKTSWAEIKDYSEEVIAAIRAVDEDNLIIVGTPFYSQFVDEASEDPIDDVNVAYTLHFYAGSESHQGQLRNRALTAIRNQIPLFVTEWGTSEADGGALNKDVVDVEQSAEWLELLYDNNISHANWSLTHKDEASAILKPTASGGMWTDADLSTSGQWVKEQVQGW